MSELTQGNDYWTPEVLSQALMGMWFAASHQPWMNLDFMILELCARPEWQVILRNEIEEYGTYDYETLEKIPLLDSFMKEIVRINPIDTRKWFLLQVRFNEFCDCLTGLQSQSDERPWRILLFRMGKFMFPRDQ